MTELEPHTNSDITARMEQQLREANERLARLEAAFREVSLLTSLQHGSADKDAANRPVSSVDSAEAHTTNGSRPEPVGDVSREAEAHFQRGVALCQNGKYDEAVAAWRQVLRLQPDNAYALANIGIVYTEQGRWPEARDMFTRVLSIKPNNAEAHYGLGMAYAQMGDYAAAAASLENTIRLQPENADARYNLNLVRQRLAQEAAQQRAAESATVTQTTTLPSRSDFAASPPASTPVEQSPRSPWVEDRAVTTSAVTQEAESTYVPSSPEGPGVRTEPAPVKETSADAVDGHVVSKRSNSRTAGTIALAVVALLGIIFFVYRYLVPTHPTNAGPKTLPPQASKPAPSDNTTPTQPPSPMPVIEAPLITVEPDHQNPVPISALQPGRMQIRLGDGVSGRFRYWFVSGSDRAAQMKPLPSPGRNGIITIPIPALYNQPGAQLRILNVSQGKVARVPILDVSHHTLLVSPNVGPNLLQNADFTQGINGWRMETVPPARATMRIMDNLSAPPGVSGRTVRFEVSVVGPQTWSVQCFQPGVNLTERTPYVLSFWAKSDRNRPLQLDAILDKPDWHRVGVINGVSLTPQWHKYMLPFNVAQVEPSHSQVSFILGGALGSVDVAGVTLRRSLGIDTSAPSGANTAVTIGSRDFN